LPEVDRASLKKDLRADDYMALYKAVSNIIGDDKVMFAAFFGKLPKDSEQAQKAKQAIASLDMVGEMIDMGTSVADIQKMAKP
ncbi:MAG TPA: hypothetical protein VLI92_01990, partial [Candidatus Saccharimonadales bacterium]|nr:hypothetical protein [Candidatus Saccharimonadales bacterium]